jgi:hypothetical protein
MRVVFLRASLMQLSFEYQRGRHQGCTLRREDGRIRDARSSTCNATKHHSVPHRSLMLVPCNMVDPKAFRTFQMVLLSKQGLRQIARRHMTARTITVTLPETVYEQLENEARVTARSVDDLVAQSLVRSLPFAPEPNLPANVQAELNAMEQLSDTSLSTIARSTANDDTIALFDLLSERQQEGTLTLEGRQRLHRLREELDALMLRKAHAFALLQRRGYTLPSLEELRAQTS